MSLLVKAVAAPRRNRRVLAVGVVVPIALALCTPTGLVVYAPGDDGRLGTDDDLWSTAQ